MKKIISDMLFTAQRKVKNSLLLLVLVGFSAGVAAIDPPPSTLRALT